MEEPGTARLTTITSTARVVALLTLVASCEHAPPPSPEPAEPAETVDHAPAPPFAAVQLTEPVTADDAPGACPDGMLLVEGMYCPEVRHTCKRWMDPEGPYHQFRCAEYAKPARCLAPKKQLRFCIDRDEYSEPGESLPANHKSFTDAKRTCALQGKRVCQESEWVFACEGEEMRPYPYGFERDSSACNADRTEIVTKGGRLRDLRAAADEYPRCESPFGVRHQAGNLEEFVAIDGTHPPRPAMKGAYWQPSRNFCRAAQTAHDAHYNGTETGFRCCAEAR